MTSQLHCSCYIQFLKVMSTYNVKDYVLLSHVQVQSSYQKILCCTNAKVPQTQNICNPSIAATAYNPIMHILHIRMNLASIQLL